MIEDFYPTPRTLISKMLAEVNNIRSIGSVLEPSAGKGDLCDAVKLRMETYSRRPDNIDVIEINPDLQATLRGKGYNLIQGDFLTFETFKAYDLIIANFPFSNGAEHLLKAIGLLYQNGGQLVCLVNAETIRNPHTQQRDMLRRHLESLKASIDFLPGEFVNAERSTDVEVALISIKHEVSTDVSIILDSLQQAAAEDAADGNAPNDVVERDFRKILVSRFNLECSVGKKLIDEYFALRPHILDRHVPADGSATDYRSPMIELKIKGVNGRESRASLVNAYLEGVREKYWTVLINDPRYTDQYTSNIKDDLHRKLTELRNCDFSIFNIEQLAKDLAMSVSKGVEDAILKLFDKLSTKYAWDESIHNGNVHYYDGWKTNKAWKINKKVIIPIYGAGLEGNYGGGSRWKYETSPMLTDMVKVFNYLAPEKTNVYRLVASSMEAAEKRQDFDCDLRYFRTKFYKKGTCHITFQDKDLLDKFNIFGSQRKGWLPPSYGKKTYEDLSTDERETVDTFQGREAYAEVMKNPEYYIVKDVGGLLGTGDES